MASLATVRDTFLISCYQNIIDDVEFALLYDESSSRLTFPYSKFEHFGNDAWDESECRTELRFGKQDLNLLRRNLQIPDEIVCSQRSVCDGMEAMCILLKRLAYPCLYTDIAVDHANILDTTFKELKTVQDPRVTFQVDFYSEMAQDSGGPRKEWIRLCNQHNKTKFFDHGLKEHLAEEYFFVGQMAGIALLQNGQAPKHFSEDLLNDIFASEERELSPCVLKLRQGLDSLGIHRFARKFPFFLYLPRPSQNYAKQTVPVLIHLLKLKFSEGV